jgi:DNA-directed RNA polymerase specialized sigma24 family protein
MSVSLDPSSPPNQASDFALTIARIRGGDERALERLLAAVAVPMRRMAEQYIGSPLRPHVDAEDLVQRVALILWHGLRDGKFEVAAPPQLLGLCRTLLRRQAAKAVQQFKPAINAMNDTAEFAIGATLFDQPVMPASCPAKKAEANEQLQRLMERVNEDDRRMLELLLLNHSIAVTARLLKIEPATLRKRLSRLRVRVRHRPNTSV